MTAKSPAPARSYWTGVRMRSVRLGVDPDDPSPRTVTLPEAWDDDAASALVELAGPGTRPVRLSVEAGRWIDMLDGEAATADDRATLRAAGRTLSCLLLLRQVAPTRALWERRTDRRPGFVLNLAAFVQDGVFAAEQFVATLRLLCDVLRRIEAAEGAMRNGELPLLAPLPSVAAPGGDAPSARAGEMLLTNLDACLAGLGLDYDSDEGRDAACALASLATSVARQGAGPVPLPPSACPIPGLGMIAAGIRDAADQDEDRPCLALVETGFSAPGPIDALLGVEACGLAPIFSALTPDGALRPSTLHRLAHHGYTPETALAASLAGASPLTLPGPLAHGAMHRALAGFVDRMPARPEPGVAEATPSTLARGVRRPLPARHGGFTQRASVGGHRLYLRTGEYDDGSLGEVSITPARESPMARGLLDCIGQAVSIGLQYGAPLDAFVERFAHTSFGPAGTVEGDPVAAYATSLLDYAFRALSDAYLGRRLPDAAPQETAVEDPDPMLPLGLPADAPRNPKLRLVS